MLEIRQATPENADEAAKLIFMSGQNSLHAMFELERGLSAEAFIAFAYVQPEGQFSYNNHIVAIVDGNLAGIGSHWTDNATQACRQGTIESLIAHFGAQHVPAIVERSILLQSIIPTPMPNGLGIGHIAVNPDYQRQGVATALLSQFRKTALAMGKARLELDVECTNQAAIALYANAGFDIVSTTQPNAQARQAGFTGHHHMQAIIAS